MVYKISDFKCKITILCSNLLDCVLYVVCRNALTIGTMSIITLYITGKVQHQIRVRLKRRQTLKNKIKPVLVMTGDNSGIISLILSHRNLCCGSHKPMSWVLIRSSLIIGFCNKVTKTCFNFHLYIPLFHSIHTAYEIRVQSNYNI